MFDVIDAPCFIESAVIHSLTVLSFVHYHVVLASDHRHQISQATTANASPPVGGIEVDEEEQRVNTLYNVFLP